MYTQLNHVLAHCGSLLATLIVEKFVKMDSVRAKANEAKLQKAKEKKAMNLRLKEGQRNAIHKIDACMASPEQLPFFSKIEIQPSEVDTHILTPPKLRSKDGVFGFDKKGKYYQREIEPLTWNWFEEYVHQYENKEHPRKQARK